MSDFKNQHQPLRASRDDGESRPPPKEERRAPPPKGGLFSSSNVLIILLAIVLLGSLGLIWKQAGDIEELTQRFDDLNSLIKSTDESLSQSGTALTLKIREQEETLGKHWSEIKKLWGVSYDRNRKAIDENAEATKKANSQARQAMSGVNKQGKQIAEFQETFNKLSSEMEPLSIQISNLSNSSLATSLQIEEIETRLAVLAKLQQQLNSLSGRVADTESALKALDVYRSQVNQQLHQLRQKVEGAP